MTSEVEATALRDEWQRLRAEHETLLTATQAMEASDDLDAMRAHQARLRDHQTKLHALIEQMEAFHQRYGPLGL